MSETSEPGILGLGEQAIVKSRHFSKASVFAWAICLLGAFFYCYEYLLRTMPGIMELELRQAFQLDSIAFGNLMGFYYYAYTPMQFPVGILIDRYGPRRLLIMASLVCALGSYLFTIESSLLISQWGRFLVGFGSAFAFVGFLKLATVWLHPKRFALISGLIMTLCMLGVTQGNMLVATLLKHQSWKDVTLLFAGLGLVIAAVMALIMPKKTDQLTAYNQETPVQSLKAISTELFRLAKNPIIWANGLVGCLMFLSLSGFAESWGVSYFEQGRGYDKTLAVHLNNYVFWGWAVGGPFMGWFSEKIAKRRSPLIYGALGTALTFAAILYLPENSPLWMFELMLFSLGFCSSSQIIVFPIARELTSSALAASALAFTNMLVMIGGVILQPGIGYLLRLRWTGQEINHLPVYSLNDYQFAMLVIAVGACLAAVVVMFMRETYQRPEERI